MKGSSLVSHTNIYHDPRVKDCTDLDVVRWWRKSRQAGVHPRILVFNEEAYFTDFNHLSPVPFNLITSGTPDRPVVPTRDYDLHWLRLQITVANRTLGGPSRLVESRDFKFYLAMVAQHDSVLQGAINNDHVWEPSLNADAGGTSFQWFQPVFDVSAGDIVGTYTPLWESRGILPEQPQLETKTFSQPAQYDVTTGAVIAQPAPVTVTSDTSSPAWYTANLVVPLSARHSMRRTTLSHHFGSWTNFPCLFFDVGCANVSEPLDADTPRVLIQAELIYTDRTD